MSYNIINGGGGNCTRGSVGARHFVNALCDKCTQGLSELCRDCEALCVLVAKWHRLTPTVREKIVELARGAG
jgi:hypothetical protein